MWQHLKRLFSAGGSGQSGDAAGDGPASQRQMQMLRLQLAECEKTAGALKQQLLRQREGEAARAEQATAARIERLLTAAAPPASQLSTQAHLLEREHKPVQAADVLAVARQLVHLLEDAGLTLDGAVGSAVDYDPDRHQPMGAGGALRPGEPCIVRFCAVALGGKVVHKALVERRGQS